MEVTLNCYTCFQRGGFRPECEACTHTGSLLPAVGWAVRVTLAVGWVAWMVLAMGWAVWTVLAAGWVVWTDRGQQAQVGSREAGRGGGLGGPGIGLLCQLY